MPMTSFQERPQRRSSLSSAKVKLDFSEVRGDLFSCSKSASLAHCVSEDMAMGKGIAKVFKEQFRGIRDLKEQGAPCHNDVIRLSKRELDG